MCADAVSCTRLLIFSGQTGCMCYQRLVQQLQAMHQCCLLRAPCHMLPLLQWPLHACTAAAQAAQQQPQSPGAYAAIKVLEAFFSTAGAHFLNATDSVPVPSLHASVRQQLQQSGLLQQLPVLMIAAAVELSLQARDKSFLRHGETMAAGEHGRFLCMHRPPACCQFANGRVPQQQAVA